MSESSKRPTLGSVVSYKDQKAGIAWLEKAFGFETSLLVTDKDGDIAHSELRLGDGYIMVAPEWSDPQRIGAATLKTPQSVGGVNTQMIHVQLEDGVDAHCERARAAGAKITQEPADQFYGDRVYIAVDPDGHVWSFGQTLRTVSNEEMEQSGGLKVESF